jgi:tetratricopeptide (TPR) repeat protein
MGSSAKDVPVLGRSDLDRLQTYMNARQIGAGLQWLDLHRSEFESLCPDTPEAFAILVCLMQWVDVGWDGLPLVRRFVESLPVQVHSELRLLDYLRLSVAQGMVHMHDQEPDAAIRRFELALPLLREGCRDRLLLALAHFWKAHCHRKKAEYDLARTHVNEARAIAIEAGIAPFVSVMRVLESWLWFQQQDLRQAVTTLQEAETVLRHTDDYVTLGNLYSGFGRIARREGRYEQALEYFARAAEEYRRRDPLHRNLARSLAHMAYVKRLIARRLQHNMESEIARRRKGSAGGAESAADTAATRGHCERLRQEAFLELDRAGGIYSTRHAHGMATVRVYRGYLFMDRGELDRAELEASEAFRLGEEKQDFIIMARARLLESLVENAKHEEGIEDPANPIIHAQRADDYAKEALSFARSTEDNRLIAHACILQGLTLSGDYLNDLDGARKYCDEAALHLKPGAHDYLWEDYETLRARILQGGNVDATLKRLSQGLVGEKSFQQITEDFAGIIIPKVWEQEGRKVSGVARRLSISPKKVRRILHRAGLDAGVSKLPSQVRS